MNHPILVLIFLGISLYLVFSFQRWKRNQPPEVVKKTFIRYGVYFLITILIFAAATGRLHWLFALIASVFGALIPVARRYLPILIRYAPVLAGLFRQAQAAKSTKGPTQGQTSWVESDFLRMTLNHDSGEMDGEILKGHFQGHLLNQLNLEQIGHLLQECRHDADSVALLEAYLDRRFGSEWRDSDEQSKNSRYHDYAQSGEMSKAEAYEILGLDENASEQEIIDAHRRLILKFHPDRGGSNYLATKINQAKQVLLAH